MLTAQHNHHPVCTAAVQDNAKPYCGNTTTLAQIRLVYTRTYYGLQFSGTEYDKRSGNNEHLLHSNDYIFQYSRNKFGLSI